MVPPGSAHLSMHACMYVCMYVCVCVCVCVCACIQVTSERVCEREKSTTPLQPGCTYIHIILEFVYRRYHHTEKAKLSRIWRNCLNLSEKIGDFCLRRSTSKPKIRSPTLWLWWVFHSCEFKP